MTVTLLDNFKLPITADMVLRGQGAEPAVICARRPQLADVAETALQKGLPLLAPLAITRRMSVVSVRHQRIDLEGGFLTGELPAQKLAVAREVFIVLCTIGIALERYASEVYRYDPALGLALDSLGSVAVDALAAEVCRRIADEAQALGLQTTFPISPGLVGWELGVGQRQIFSLLKPDPGLIRLEYSGQMIPLKSTSLVIGWGEDVDHTSSTCDYCAVRFNCRYQPSLTSS
ncbi:MAG: hypothetical protein WHV66_00405 [Anaerolineales bacterium]|jgi:hypothetical protein